jgi:hypothetical protein
VGAWEAPAASAGRAARSEATQSEDNSNEHATALADALEAAIPGWLARAVARYAAVDAAAVTRAGSEAASETAAEVRALLARDIDDQTETPLTIVRRIAVPHATRVLRDAGAPPVRRDEFKARSFADDVYDLTPASWADIDESVQAPGIAWGAWKAMTYKARHTA